MIKQLFKQWPDPQPNEHYRDYLNRIYPLSSDRWIDWNIMPDMPDEEQFKYHDFPAEIQRAKQTDEE